jgi:hypothetical protein
MAVRGEKVAEQLDVEGIVLDNQNPGHACTPQSTLFH